MRVIGVIFCLIAMYCVGVWTGINYEKQPEIVVPEVLFECPEPADFDIIMIQDGVSWRIEIKDKQVTNLEAY